MAILELKLCDLALKVCFTSVEVRKGLLLRPGFPCCPCPVGFELQDRILAQELVRHRYRLHHEVKRCPDHPGLIGTKHVLFGKTQ